MSERFRGTSPYERLEHNDDAAAKRVITVDGSGAENILFVIGYLQKGQCGCKPSTVLKLADISNIFPQFSHLY